jgi:hypothetical protein
MDAAATTTYGIITYNFDPMVVFGTNTPIYGITGSAGGLNNQQYFCVPAILLGSNITDFNAQLNLDTEVNLNWTAVSQNSNDYFVVEKNADHMNFEEVAMLGIQGATNQANYYATVDPNPFFGISYYRLKEVSIDGSITYSAVKAVERKASNNSINIYPNPVLAEVTIELAEAGNITLELKNQLGQQLGPVTIFSGNKTTLDLSSLTSGIYLLQIVLNNSIKKAFKIVKK